MKTSMASRTVAVYIQWWNKSLNKNSGLNGIRTHEADKSYLHVLTIYRIYCMAVIHFRKYTLHRNWKIGRNFVKLKKSLWIWRFWRILVKCVKAKSAWWNWRFLGQVISIHLALSCQICLLHQVCRQAWQKFVKFAIFAKLVVFATLVSFLGLL